MELDQAMSGSRRGMPRIRDVLDLPASSAAAVPSGTFDPGIPGSCGISASDHSRLLLIAFSSDTVAS